MKITFTQSARKHRIGKSHVLYAMGNSEPYRTLGANGAADHLTWVAPDDRGLVLEIEVVVLEKALLVIHVMPHNFRKGKSNG